MAVMLKYLPFSLEKKRLKSFDPSQKMRKIKTKLIAVNLIPSKIIGKFDKYVNNLMDYKIFHFIDKLK